LQNYFDEFINLHNAIKDKVNLEIKNLKDFSEEMKTDIKSRIDSEIKNIKEIKEDVNETKKSIESTRNQVEQTNNNIHNNRTARTSWTLLIGTFLISIIIPILVNKMTFDKDDYMLFDHTKELKEKMDDQRNEIEELKRDNKQLKSTLDSLIKHS